MMDNINIFPFKKTDIIGRKLTLPSLVSFFVFFFLADGANTLEAVTSH